MLEKLLKKTVWLTSSLMSCLMSYQTTKHSLHKICEDTGFHWPVHSRIKTESTILFLYGRIQASENPYSRIFYAVIWYFRKSGNFRKTSKLLIIKDENWEKWILHFFCFFKYQPKLNFASNIALTCWYYKR